MAIKKYSENRPWGGFERFTLNELSTVKLITVNPGESLSLQYHQNREEFWRVIKGAPLVVIDGVETSAKEGDEFFVQKGKAHQLRGGPSGGVILEIALGEFREEDEVRVSDKYGRQGTQSPTLK